MGGGIPGPAPDPALPLRSGHIIDRAMALGQQIEKDGLSPIARLCRFNNTPPTKEFTMTFFCILSL